MSLFSTHTALMGMPNFLKKNADFGFVGIVQRYVRIKLLFWEHSFKTPHSFLDNVTKTILHCLLFHLFCNLCEVEGLMRFGMGQIFNDCITYKHFSSNFHMLLFINVIKVNPKIFCANHSWPQACSVQLLDCKIILLKETEEPYTNWRFTDRLKMILSFFSWAKDSYWNFQDPSTMMYLRDLSPSLFSSISSQSMFLKM